MEIGLSQNGKGRYFPLMKSRVRIGADPTCDVVIEAPQVDARHAEIRVSRTGIEIDDLRSAHGTKVNGYAIDEHFLSQGDKIDIGSVSFTLEFHEARQAETARCERCGVETDTRTTRRLSRSLLDSTPRLLCSGCLNQSSPGDAGLMPGFDLDSPFEP